MYNNNVSLQDPHELTQPGTAIKLTNCKCPNLTDSVEFDVATNCRFITVPVKLINLCPNKDFLLFVTVYDNAKNRIGQICSIVNSPMINPCTTPYTYNVTLAIKKPVCSTDTIYIEVKGNYTSICDI